ncbi:siderophore-interacting protein [Paractinoplanes durhamensis]|uniref:Siderophore-interacting protein n=1 Tax=Paractinoplanes durhamensis TaxID=113563 RepID=A0ABQ3YSS5_9ACTN|nr:siderophore-interacting protein [Actinoplanes durhamensis]GIE00638.1 siderophore-interacting protein [Actinoplanes durhamensis]
MAKPFEDRGLIRREPRTPRRRVLRVTRVEELSPTMRRIWLGGDDLEADFPFSPLGATDHIKLVPPDPATGRAELPPPGGPRPDMRDYTVRRFDPVAKELALDFVLHSHGPAGRWAIDAVPGAEIGVLGPRGTQIYPDFCSDYLLVADETGLPALERFLEELPAGVPIRVIALGASPRGLPGDAEVTWLPDATTLVTTVAGLPFGPESFAWGAGETGEMRELRTHLRSRLDAERVSVRGYWKQGHAGNVPREEED